MKKTMNQLFEVVVYFFTPEDSTVKAGPGNISINMGGSRLDMGSLKAIFWVAGTMGMFYLMTKI